MTTGYAGKILVINLTNMTSRVLATEQYEEFGGGLGMGTAVFWDLCPEKAISGFDPRNVTVLMSSPLDGTLTPSAARAEMCGIGVYSYPIDWFSRGTVGGFFSTMLKYAGWDGLAVEGKADKPVWINIINDKVTFEDAQSLWGLDAATAQQEIWRRTTGRDSFGDWLSLGDSQTTQGPSILCIGPGGESLTRMGTIQHGVGRSLSQSGFGSVWGSKNLKAISVIGTGGVKVARPNDILALRKAIEDIGEEEYIPRRPIEKTGRRTSCAGCFHKCGARVKSGLQNDSKCITMEYVTEIPPGGRSGSDVIQTCGLSMVEIAPIAFADGIYLQKLYEAGILGPGKEIDSSPLPMDKVGEAAFAEALCHAIVNREGIGADLAEGLMRAAKKWGRLEKDLASGLLRKAEWGHNWHWSLPFVEQAYGSLMSERDITQHLFAHGTWNFLWKLDMPVDKLIETLSRQMIPYADDPFMFDYSWQEADGSNMKQALATGIYSSHRAKMVAWHRYFSHFWEESILCCEMGLEAPFCDNISKPGGIVEVEPKFFNAITGKKLTFAQGMETGRKIWNLHRAIWVLQGRHRDMENFAEFMYTPAGSLINVLPDVPPIVNAPVPVYQNGKWEKTPLEKLYLDKAGVEQWKTHFYELEGWDVDSGSPTRNTLEEVGLKNAADTLESAGKLGKYG